MNVNSNINRDSVYLGRGLIRVGMKNDLVDAEMLINEKYKKKLRMFNSIEAVISIAMLSYSFFSFYSLLSTNKYKELSPILFLGSFVSGIFLGKSLAKIRTIFLQKLADMRKQEILSLDAFQASCVPEHSEFLNEKEIKKILSIESPLKNSWLERANFQQMSMVASLSPPIEFQKLIRGIASKIGYIHNDKENIEYWLFICDLKKKSPNEIAAFFEEKVKKANQKGFGWLSEVWTIRRIAAKIVGKQNENCYIEPLFQKTTDQKLIEIKVPGKGIFKVDKTALLKNSKTLINMGNDVDGSSLNELTIPIAFSISKDSYQLFFDILNGDKNVFYLDTKIAQNMLLLSDHLDVESLVEFFSSYLFAMKNKGDLSPEAFANYNNNYFRENETPDKNRIKELHSLLEIKKTTYFKNFKVVGNERDRLNNYFTHRERTFQKFPKNLYLM